ncbi:MAG: hypothetical protein D6771_01695, partial [Zetaproteobacteria bacterium]
MARYLWLALLACVSACSDYAPTPTSTTAPFVVRYDPNAGVIPFPNDIVRDPATGRLALPPAST